MAATVVSDIGDMRRFPTLEQLMAYLGLIPSEHCSGKSVRRGLITKTGNRRYLLWDRKTPDNRQRQLHDETSLAVTKPRISA